MNLAPLSWAGAEPCGCQLVSALHGPITFHSRESALSLRGQFLLLIYGWMEGLGTGGVSDWLGTWEGLHHLRDPSTWPVFTPFIRTLLPYLSLDQVCSEVSRQWEVPRKELMSPLCPRAATPLPWCPSAPPYSAPGERAPCISSQQ